MDIRRLSADFTAGLTVSFAAISLGAAFGIMSGRGAFAGMIGAAVLPLVASLFGGTRIQASGPTAPMTAVSALVIAFAYDKFPDKSIAEQFITLVFILNALLLIVAGLVGLGKFIRLIPNAVILGFMNGITLLILADQVQKLFGLNGSTLGGGIVLNTVIAFATFALIYLIIRFVRYIGIGPPIKSFISGVLWSIVLMTLIASVFHLNIEHVTLNTRLESWKEVEAHLVGYFPTMKVLTGEYMALALGYAFKLMLLSYLDSLLTAMVVDKMTHEKSKLNKELLAQGLANGASSLLQGLPGAQATIRSVLLIKEGAQTRLAGVLIGIFTLLGILVFQNLISLVPAAVFIGVLMKAGLDVADKEFIGNYLKRGWIHIRKRNIQLILIMLTTLITVVVDLNVAVISVSILYYLLRYFFKIEDVESTST